MLSAEGKGFEPLIGFLLYTLSRRASSTTPAPLREGGKNTAYNSVAEYFFGICSCTGSYFFNSNTFNFRKFLGNVY
jgi:hypothetical protein